MSEPTREDVARELGLDTDGSYSGLETASFLNRDPETLKRYRREGLIKADSPQGEASYSGAEIVRFVLEQKFRPTLTWPFWQNKSPGA